MNIFKLLKPKESVSYLMDSTPIDKALEQMRTAGYSDSPVLSEDGHYLGCVNEGDFLWFIMDHNIISYDNANQYRVSDLIRPGYNPAMKTSVTVSDLLERSRDQNFIPITDDRNFFIGIVTRQAIISTLIPI
ncbi:MAG: CBS domain-containing protein [Lachnospiraceae bacterium]|nr:CBS domain-containing protein [Lachnospiraceae bacterium]